MSIHIDTCPGRERLVVATRSSVYELVILADDGHVLVRGGSHFEDFRLARFLCSTAAGGALDPHAIEVGFRMMFAVGERLFVTSPVQSVVQFDAAAASTDSLAAP